jgi:hypothetical protein
MLDTSRIKMSTAEEKGKSNGSFTSFSVDVVVCTTIWYLSIPFLNSPYASTSKKNKNYNYSKSKVHCFLSS